MEYNFQEPLKPAGFDNQTPLDGFTHNVKRAPFRQPVVEKASHYASTIETKRGKVRLSLVANRAQHSREMRGALRSVVVEGLWLYQCAPDGVNPITWALDSLAEQLAKYEVVVKEYRDSDGVQRQVHDIISPAGFKQAADHLTAALKHAERIQNRKQADSRAARAVVREAEQAARAASLKAAIGLS